MSLEETLFRVKKAEYGANYESHYIEQYKLYVEMADRISSRRQLAVGDNLQIHFSYQ